MALIKICPYCGERMEMVYEADDLDSYWECFDCGCCLTDGGSTIYDEEVDWVEETFEKS